MSWLLHLMQIELFLPWVGGKLTLQFPFPSIFKKALTTEWTEPAGVCVSDFSIYLIFQIDYGESSHCILLDTCCEQITVSLIGIW